MQIGKWLLVKHEGRILRGTVIQIFREDLEIQLEDSTTIRRKFWEVRAVPYDNPKEEV
jgi:hypothetical protein